MSTLHRFVRNPNYLAGPWNRTGNRAQPFENTLVQLVCPKTERTLYLVGTTNSNSILAYRTQKLIQGIIIILYYLVRFPLKTPDFIILKDRKSVV